MVAPAARRLDRRRPGGYSPIRHHAPRRIILLTLLILLAACNPASRPVSQSHANEPKVRATVITIQTTMPPKSWTHTITIANDRARSSDEADEWRLFDFKEKRVTFVDDLAKTYRTASFAEVLQLHRAALTRPLPEGMPRASFLAGSAQKTVQGVIAKQSTIRVGAYQRDLWIALHPLIPPDLFTMMQASQPSSSPLAGVMRPADEALLSIHGFPMADHAELPFEKRKLVVDSVVVSIDQRDIPAASLNVSASYTEVKGTTETAKPLQGAK